MKCVVTGGSGFIGSYVVSELVTRGFDVVVYDVGSPRKMPQLPKTTYVAGDVRDFNHLLQVIEDADFVFHLAGVLGTEELFYNPTEAIEINIGGSLNVLLGCKAATSQKRIFFPTKPNEWNNIYSVTTQAREKLAHAYRENFDIDVRVLRVWDVYGPRQEFQTTRKAVPTFITQALDDRPIEVFGDGTQSVELNFVEDVARSIVEYMLTKERPSETYEFNNGVHTTVFKLARMIVEMTGSRSKIQYLPMRRGERAGTKFARARDLQELLGVLQSTPVEVGMGRTIEWYRHICRN